MGEQGVRAHKARGLRGRGEVRGRGDPPRGTGGRRRVTGFDNRTTDVIRCGPHRRARHGGGVAGSGHMLGRARLVLAPAIALAVVAILVSLIPAPATAFPTSPMYDRILAAPGVGPIAVGDVNGDGLTDVVSVDDGAGMYDVFLQTLSGLPGAPTMTFQGPVSREVAIADMDGDGKNDIVSLGANSTRIFYQDFGSFGTRFAVVPTSGTHTAIGDLNGDGRRDIATLTSSAVQIWLQNLTQGPWPASPSVNITATAYHDLAVADLRNDGLVDLVLGKPFEVHLFPQTPGRLDPAGTSMFVGTFNGSATVSLGIARMDGDGMPDIVLGAVDSGLGYGELSVYLQKGDSFNLSTKLSGPFTGVFAVGDLNDDGRMDIAAAMHDRVTTTDTIAVFLQHFAGGFGASPTFQLSVDGLGGSSGIAIGRFSARPFYDVATRTQGAVLVYHQEDLSPVMIRAIPSDASFNVGASGAGLLDLRNYFSDDHGVLHFDVVYEDNFAFLHATVAADGHHLDFTAP